MAPRTMTAKYPGTCKACRTMIEVGQTIRWAAGEGARHKTCPEAAWSRMEDERGAERSPWMRHDSRDARDLCECSPYATKSQMRGCVAEHDMSDPDAAWDRYKDERAEERARLATDPGEFCDRNGWTVGI